MTRPQSWPVLAAVAVLVSTGIGGPVVRAASNLAAEITFSNPSVGQATVATIPFTPLSDIPVGGSVTVSLAYEAVTRATASTTSAGAVACSKIVFAHSALVDATLTCYVGGRLSGGSKTELIIGSTGSQISGGLVNAARVIVNHRASVSTSGGLVATDTFSIVPLDDPATRVAVLPSPVHLKPGQNSTLLAQLLDRAGLPTNDGSTAAQLAFFAAPPAVIEGVSTGSAPNGNAHPGRCGGPGAAGASWTDAIYGEVVCSVTEPASGSAAVTVELVSDSERVPHSIVGLPAGTAVVQVAAGAYHSLALTAAGGVLAWGDNAAGELGDGTTVTRYEDVVTQIPSGTTVSALVGGGYFSLALTSTGTVLAWGANYDGQLGNGTTRPADKPLGVDLPIGTSVAQIAAGCNDALALTSEGRVLAWGQNVDGALGDGSTQSSSLPVYVGLPSTVTIRQVAAGCNFNLALATDGTLWAWGQGSDGQLGDGGTPQFTTTPVLVAIPPGRVISQIQAGAFDGLARTETGGVLAWGSNSDGQLGNGKTTSLSLPTPVSLPGGVSVASIAAGGFNNLALAASGTLYGWGLNSNGQVGTGALNAQIDLPEPVAMLSGVTVSSMVGAPAGGFHNLAITTGGQVLAWGANYDAQLGNGTIGQQFASLATGTGGAVFAMGDNNAGQLGTGTTSSTASPVLVGLPLGTAARTVSEGCSHSLAVTTDGRLLSWGGDFDGQLGQGTWTQHDIPGWVTLPGGAHVDAAEAGCLSSVALTTAGKVWAWGSNVDGQLGDGGTKGSAAPVRVAVPAGVTVTQLAAGCYHVLALTSSGSVLSWGANTSGQLGDGNNVNSAVPVAVAFPAGTVVTAVTAGCEHSLALTSSGQLWAWGSGQDGQLGTGSFSDSNVPVQVILPSGATVTSIAAGLFHSLAATSQGEVLGWGFDGDSQLGSGINVNSATDYPSPVAALLPAGTDVASVAAGGNSSFALTPSGVAFAWGDGLFGQLGDGTNTTQTVPVELSPAATGPLSMVATGGDNGTPMISPVPILPGTSTVSFG